MSAHNSKAKYRIARFDFPDGKTEFQIQERGFFGWHSACFDYADFPECFNSLEEAERRLNSMLPRGKPKMTIVKQV